MSNKSGIDQERLQPIALGAAGLAACGVMENFVRDVVRPVTEGAFGKMESQVMFAPMACNTIAARIHAWLLSINKLSNATDFQAVLAGSRALFEIAVDMTLFNLQEKGNFAKLMAWQQSAQLKWAKGLLDSGLSNDPTVIDFVKMNRDKIQALRKSTWPKHGTKHPSRWTGNDLGTDARNANELRESGFVAYYNGDYTPANWHVHGSGVMGLLSITPQLFPILAGKALHHCATFAMVACQQLIALVGKYDDEMDARFAQLDTDMANASRSAYDDAILG